MTTAFRKIDIDALEEETILPSDLYDPDPRGTEGVRADAQRKSGEVRGLVSRWVPGRLEMLHVVCVDECKGALGGRWKACEGIGGVWLPRRSSQHSRADPPITARAELYRGGPPFASNDPGLAGRKRRAFAPRHSGKIMLRYKAGLERDLHAYRIALRAMGPECKGLVAVYEDVLPGAAPEVQADRGRARSHSGRLGGLAFAPGREAVKAALPTRRGRSTLPMHRERAMGRKKILPA